MLFEFLTGSPPFNDTTSEQIFDNILSLRIPWPDEGVLPEDAVDLIKKLLVLDPEKRLGAKGAAEVKKHPFFSDINWDHLMKKKPMYIPYIENEEDTDNFEGNKFFCYFINKMKQREKKYIRLKMNKYRMKKIVQKIHYQIIVVLMKA